MVCTPIVEPSDPHAWNDNFLCAPADYGLRWSFAGPLPDMRCISVERAVRSLRLDRQLPVRAALSGASVL